MSDAYNIRPGGALKLKSGASEGGVVKKKKKKSKSRPEAELEAEHERAKEQALKQDISSLSPEGSGRGSPAVVNGNNNSSRKTEAEKRFEETQRQRLAQKVAKLALKTHKDRVAEFNKQLETLSEHHDIPKVGPG
ncbi:hypothetical protein JOM56_006488 [Amanita muscaria]|uniref:DUF1754-domain-containing protein n=1 Tax=Amanita muscaria (strain Koide BX008) TaxID=946122 RepID=A0A0C2XPX7_AMAMK|nr:hypothetical protein M378DRAFT_183051 [Amanita muscaria Koide BX008]